jgi:hypothetical protein
MFKNLFLSAVLAVFVFSVADAQDDSLYYDLGRVLVKKSGTQTVSIKGKDLEKYQVSDLSDAINVWLYGTYTKNTSIIYVIDGNIISDVNAYSIFDIEEVTLVQTAVAQSSGAAAGQQMVLIKTRTNRAGKKGIEVNGQNSLVGLNSKNIAPGATASNQVYDQYYIAAYRNYKNANIGLTADYQRDVDPGSTGNGLELLDPAHYNRLKLNAYADVKLGKRSILIIGANYVPQTNNLSYTKDTTAYGVPPLPENIFYKSHISQHMANANINLKTDIATGLTNRFSVAYNHYNYFESDYLNDVVDTFTNRSLPNFAENSHNLLVRDYLSYHNTLLDSLKINWTLNMTYRNFEDSLAYHLTTVFFTPHTPTYTSTQPSGTHFGYENLMLTPTFDLYYKEVVNAQGGFVALLDKGKAGPGTGPAGHFFPFFTTSFNPAKLLGIPFIKWQIFASYARQSPLLADNYSTLAAFNLMTPPGSVPYNVKNFNLYQQYDNYQTGTSVGLTRNFSITYSYEYKYYQYYAEDPNGDSDINGGIQYLPYNGRSVTSRFSLLYNLHAHNFTWNAALNGAETHLEVVDNPALAATSNAAYLSAGHRWSGGYTNRFEFNSVFAGLDFLYQDGARPDDLINAIPTANNFIAPSANDSFTLQNAYFGVRIKVPHMKFIEIYANGRNILQNSSSNITDGRRFFGGGFKAGF